MLVEGMMAQSGERNCVTACYLYICLGELLLAIPLFQLIPL